MRLVVIALALLAGLKIWNNERLYREAAEEAILAAYRERATSACQKDAARHLTGPSAQEAPRLWGRSAEISLVIGKPRVDVALWDVENPLWAIRYKRPFLVLKRGDGSAAAVCTYDVLAGQAEIAGS